MLLPLPPGREATLRHYHVDVRVPLHVAPREVHHRDDPGADPVPPEAVIEDALHRPHRSVEQVLHKPPHVSGHQLPHSRRQREDEMPVVHREHPGHQRPPPLLRVAFAAAGAEPPVAAEGEELRVAALDAPVRDAAAAVVGAAEHGQHRGQLVVRDLVPVGEDVAVEGVVVS